MGSLRVLFSAREPFHAFAKGRCRARVRVRNNAGRDAVEKVERVELVKESLGSCHSARWCIGKLVERGQRQLLEFPRRKNARDETNCVRLVSTENAASADQI